MYKGLSNRFLILPKNRKLLLEDTILTTTKDFIDNAIDNDRTATLL